MDRPPPPQAATSVSFVVQVDPTPVSSLASREQQLIILLLTLSDACPGNPGKCNGSIVALKAFALGEHFRARAELGADHAPRPYRRLPLW